MPWGESLVIFVAYSISRRHETKKKERKELKRHMNTKNTKANAAKINEEENGDEWDKDAS